MPSSTPLLLIPDVNILVGAFRRDIPGHLSTAGLWQSIIAGSVAFVVPDIVASGFLRLVTNPRVFKAPTETVEALEFISAYRSSIAYQPQPNPPGLWPVFESLCSLPRIRGDLIPDAFLAAFAIAADAELLSFDRDFARFPGLRWRAPA